jgi:tetratricopeptide (TPR) repeat protein
MRDWDEAEYLERIRLDRYRRRATPLLKNPSKKTIRNNRSIIRSLAVSIELLGTIQRSQEMPECVDLYKEAISLYQLIGDQTAEAILAFNIGQAYERILKLEDLDEAERWLKRSLELFEDHDWLGKSMCLCELGFLAHYKWILGGLKTQQLNPNLLKDSEGYFQRALKIIPPDAFEHLAKTHRLIGNVLGDSGFIEESIRHLSQGIQYYEMISDGFGAGQARITIAIALARVNRLSDALQYAYAALRNFESYSHQLARTNIVTTKDLIAMIERLISESDQ